MKKITLLGAFCALMLSQSALAQTNEGVTYVEDPSQGYVMNKFSDNWFITGEGGVTLEVNKNDGKAKFKDRIEPAAGLYVGKWFSPVIGLRLGANWMQVRSYTYDPWFWEMDKPEVADGLRQNKMSYVGPMGDVMINLTNWWCGYRPGRVYNAIAYAGAGAYFGFAKEYNDKNESLGWKYAHERVLSVRAGLINQFNITKHFALALDLRYSALDSHSRYPGNHLNVTSHVLQAYVNATYFFNKTDWTPVMVPVCPPVQDCEPIQQQLNDANARIAELERQLETCLKRPAGKAVTIEKEAPLATIYFPINVSTLTAQDKNVLNAVAEVIKNTPSQKYNVTGWADNYTGNDEINVRLRHARANSAAAQLESQGVPESQLNVGINNGSLAGQGEKFVALDRAVTIEKAQ